MLLGLSTPVALAVLVYFVYAMIVFREREPAAVLDGPPIRGHAGVQMWWLVTTTAIVLFLAGYGIGPAARRRLRRRPGAEPDRQARPARSSRRSRSR